MILLQLSSAQGPEECCLAVAKALERLIKEASSQDVELDILEQEPGRHPNTFRSALVSLQGENSALLAQRWCGTLQWVCASPFRQNYSRKNWFIGIAQFALPDLPSESQIVFETCRSSGPGGQHVNKTESAVRATHLASGISVKVQSERSQRANKRLAVGLIAYRLRERQQNADADRRFERRMFHHQIERGNPVKTFTGVNFIEKI
jgi:peptide chain release factor